MISQESNSANVSPTVADAFGKRTYARLNGTTDDNEEPDLPANGRRAPWPYVRP